MSLSPDQLESLRPYVLDLSQGRYSREGMFASSPADVARIFTEHIPAAIADRAPDAGPLPLMIWAHGGLVGEEAGLRVALDQVSWWRSLGVYPLFFVWETGFADALRQILDARARSRDLWDVTTDPAVEAAARALGGVKVWAAMKASAADASAPGGAAADVATAIATLCAEHPGRVSLHAAGHSAGAIFQAEFLTRCRERGAPPFASLALLAPAIRVDRYRALLEPLLGDYVGHTSIYTMKRERERDDFCGTARLKIYNKSLLYLIERALEPEPLCPILGLEDCLRADPALAYLLSGDDPRGQVFWSVSPGRTSSTTHGGFDNDPDTMNSVAAELLGVPRPQHPYPGGRLSREVTTWGGPSPLELPPSRSEGPAPGDLRLGPGATPGRGRLRALCIGIDAYPGPNGLTGCVADARSWAATLEAVGFEAPLLLDRDATREAMLAAITELVVGARPGDVLALQYSGHGTTLRDLDGDETGPGDHTDEAICPVDFSDGSVIVDDDLRAILERLPAGADLTTFMDCCYSKSNTRMLAPAQPPVTYTTGRHTERARMVPPSIELDTAARTFRRRRGFARIPRVRATSLTHVAFSACQDFEVAWEYDGHGHFTSVATRLLSATGASPRTNTDFYAAVLAGFGQNPRQTPALEPGDDRRPFLGGVTATGVGTTSDVLVGSGGPAHGVGNGHAP